MAKGDSPPFLVDIDADKELLTLEVNLATLISAHGGLLSFV